MSFSALKRATKKPVSIDKTSKFKPSINITYRLYFLYKKHDL